MRNAAVHRGFQADEPLATLRITSSSSASPDPQPRACLPAACTESVPAHAGKELRPLATPAVRRGIRVTPIIVSRESLYTPRASAAVSLCPERRQIPAVTCPRGAFSSLNPSQQSLPQASCTEKATSPPLTPAVVPGSVHRGGAEGAGKDRRRAQPQLRVCGRRQGECTSSSAASIAFQLSPGLWLIAALPCKALCHNLAASGLGALVR